VSPEARIIGFVVLMVAVFLGAYKAGSLIGPVIPAHAPAQSPGGGMPPTMNMGAGQARLLMPAIRSADHR
jgi:hypothetical protein